MQSKCYKSEEFHVAQSAVSENGHSMRDAHTSVFHLLGGDILCFFANQDEIWHSTVHLKFHATSGPNREKKMGRGASKL